MNTRLAPLLLLIGFCATALSAQPIPAVVVDDGSLHASTKGDIYLRWRGEALRRYRVESSTDIIHWSNFTEVVCLGEECAPMVKRHYVPPSNNPTKPDPEVRKFWRVTPFDFDSDGDGISDHDETLSGTDPFAGTRIPLQSHFVPFGLCLNNSSFSYTPDKQISLCQAAGYTGYGLASLSSGGYLKVFADHTEVSSGRFRIYSALWWTDLAKTIDWVGFDYSLVQAARMNMAVWMVVAGTKSAEDIDAAYARIKTAAQHCAAHGVKLVLYPHQGTTFVTAEEALALLLRLRADPDLTAEEKACASISVHLCHELKASNGDRIAEVVAAVAPYCTLASISGAEADTAKRSGWDSGIEPLDQGTYDVRPFLRALADAGYTGPMEYHTYNLPDPKIVDHLRNTLVRWQQLVAPPAP